MKRRDLLAWISRVLASGVATIVGLPGIQYLLGGNSSRSSTGADFTRVIRVKDLAAGRPTIVRVMGQKQDAWIRHDQQVVGRVWLVLNRPEEGTAGSDPGKSQVRAMSSICPHMGCQIQAQPDGKGFNCPCHRAAFSLDGQRQPDQRTGDKGPAPRGLDDLDCRMVQDGSTGDWWVEVKYERFETGLEKRVARI